jgi:beta-galactosidase
MGRHAAHPAVIGFQVDNEPGLVLFHNEGVFQRFVDALRRKYGDVETLNERWGLVYWSHRLTRWADLWRPDGNAQPQYDLAWRRFQAEETTDFIDWQAGIVRQYTRPDQFVTTCLAYDRPAVDDEALGDRLDILGGNPYYVMQDALTLPSRESRESGWKIRGVWALFQTADRMYASRQAPFLVTETNATSIGEPWDNRPAFDGQWRQAAWALISRGARMIEYWHWNTLRFGGETYWGGVLPHSGRPGRTYREIAALGAELEAAGGLISDLRPEFDLTMLLSLPSKWLMQEHPPLATPTGGPDHDSYRGLFDPFYRGAFEAGCQVRIMHVGQLVQTDGATEHSMAEMVREHPLLVVPGLYVVDDATLRWLADYAAAGGHLVMGPRTAYGDDEARARVDLAPAYLAAAAGVWYDEFSNLADVIPVAGVEGSLDVPASARATRWIDGLTLDGAESLASYDHPHFGRWPAITSNRHGAGRVTVVGTVPDRDLARALFRYLVPRPVSGWEALPPSVTAATARTRDGRRVHVVHDWSWDPTEVNAPADLRGVASTSSYPAGAAIQLRSWDVQVFIEDGAEGAR